MSATKKSPVSDGHKEHVAGATEILTVGGRYVTPLDLQPQMVYIKDIAHALSNQCRYSGHTREFYSVAEHSVRCLWYVQERWPDEVGLHLATLLHDAPEAYLQDMARPLKEDPRFGQAYRGAEKRAERAVAKALKFQYPFDPRVKEADLVLLATERRDLMPPNGIWGILEGVETLEAHITPWRPLEAREAFLSEYNEILDMEGLI